MYGTKQQTNNIDTSKPLTPKEIKFLQSKLGTALYYARIMDYTTITVVNNISLLRTKVTKNTNKLINKLFDYIYTNPDAKLMFQKSDMILKGHSDGSYLYVKNSWSRAAGHYYMGDNIPIH